MSYPYFGQNTIHSPSPVGAQPIPAQAPQMTNQQTFNLNQQYQSLFPQPTGSVYNLNTASDIGNIPAGMGFSVGLCLQENIMYIKTLQNGSPMLLAYRLSPIEGQPEQTQPAQPQRDSNESLLKENQNLTEALRSYDEKFQRLEKQLAVIKKEIGGKGEWQI